MKFFTVILYQVEYGENDETKEDVIKLIGIRLYYTYSRYLKNPNFKKSLKLICVD